MTRASGAPALRNAAASAGVVTVNTSAMPAHLTMFLKICGLLRPVSRRLLRLFGRFLKSSSSSQTMPTPRRFRRVIRSRISVPLRRWTRTTSQRSSSASGTLPPPSGHRISCPRRSIAISG